MSKKRLVVISVLFLALFGIGLGVAALIPEGRGVTKENFDRSQRRMTLAQVQDILGVPTAQGLDGPNRWEMMWDNPDGNFASIYFEDGLVKWMNWHYSEENMLKKICRWLHLR